MVGAAHAEPVTVVITRRIKPGREADYESWVKGVAAVTTRYPGHLGISTFRPEKPGDPYVLVYKFDTGEHLDAWLRSRERDEWVARADEMTEGTYTAQQHTGLETWFTLPGSKLVAPPPRWKMAVVTAIAVWPSAELLGALYRALLGGLPRVFASLATTLTLVTLLTWVVMPLLTRALARWLYPPRSGRT
jgi:uncharacterized protein